MVFYWAEVRTRSADKFSKIWWWFHHAVGCVASTGTGNLVKVEARMDSNQYQQILETNVQDSVTKLKLRRGWIFQQDNDPKHCSKSTNVLLVQCSGMAISVPRPEYY
ncbi:hypothetical protein NFI96_021096 [Prochilodus magdalenae]|nr:hypothetical protein NFI96_021096 [Prochilodus magdalenae]